MNTRIVSSALVLLALAMSPSFGASSQFRAKIQRFIGLSCLVSPYGRTGGQMIAFKLGFRNVGVFPIEADKTIVLTGAPFGTLSYKLNSALQPNEQFSVWDFPISQKPTSCVVSVR